MIKYVMICLGLCWSFICSSQVQAAQSQTLRQDLTRLAKQVPQACEDSKAAACKTWQVQLQRLLLRHPQMSIDDVNLVMEQVYSSEHFAYFGKLFFLENVEQIYFNNIKQHHINYLKKPAPDALPGVNQTYQQSLKDLQYAEKNKSRYIETMCAPIRTVWAGGSGLDSAYAECKAELIKAHLTILMHSWAELHPQS